MNPRLFFLHIPKLGFSSGCSIGCSKGRQKRLQQQADSTAPRGKPLADVMWPHLQLEFRTGHSQGLLFYTGEDGRELTVFPTFLHWSTWSLIGSWLESDDTFLQTLTSNILLHFYSEAFYFLYFKKKIYKIKFDNIFYLGNGLDNNVILYLKDSELKLSLQLGSEQLKTGVSKVLFNDTKWHKVDILRRAEKVSSSTKSYPLFQL